MNFSKPKIFNFFDCNFQHFHFYFYLKPHKVKRSTAILFRGSSGVAWHRPGWMGASPAHSGPVPGHGLVQAPPLPEQSPLCAAGPSARFGPAVGSERGGCFSADVIRFFSATSFDQRRAFFFVICRFVSLFGHFCFLGGSLNPKNFSATRPTFTPAPLHFLTKSKR